VRSIDAAQDWLDAQAVDIADKLLGRFRAVPQTRVVPWVTLAASVALAAAGGLLLGLAQGDAHTLADTTQPLDPTQVMHLAGEGRTFEATGYALLAIGGVGLAASALWLALGGRSGPAVSVTVAPGAAGVRWSVTW
jgi:hypothetical protein